MMWDVWRIFSCTCLTDHPPCLVVYLVKKVDYVHNSCFRKKPLLFTFRLNSKSVLLTELSSFFIIKKFILWNMTLYLMMTDQTKSKMCLAWPRELVGWEFIDIFCSKADVDVLRKIDIVRTHDPCVELISISVQFCVGSNDEHFYFAGK